LAKPMAQSRAHHVPAKFQFLRKAESYNYTNHMG